MQGEGKVNWLPAKTAGNKAKNKTRGDLQWVVIGRNREQRDRVGGRMVQGERRAERIFQRFSPAGVPPLQPLLYYTTTTLLLH